MNKIAILVNCRVEGNPNSNLQKLADTLANYSTYPERIELRVKFDDDDALAPTLLKNLVAPKGIDFRYIIEPRGRGYIDIHHGYNRLLGTITSDVELIVAMADDFKVDMGWDEALWKKYGEAAGQYMIIHQRGHPPSDRPDFGTRPFKPPEEIFTKGEDLYVVDEAPCWSRALVFASTWLGAGLSFTDGWTLALEYELWKNHGISITQFTDKQYIHRKVHPVVDTAQGARWNNDRLTNFDYMRSSYFRELVTNQATNIAERVLSCGIKKNEMPDHSHGDATSAADPQTIVSTAPKNAPDTGKPISTASKPPLFSIVFPTRERTELLENLLKSIAKNTTDLKNIEIRIAYDIDDQATADFILAKKFPELPITWVCGTRSLNFSRDYYTSLALSTSGKWVVVINDDTEFRTPGWDTIAAKALQDAIGDGPNVMYGWVEDNLGKARAMQFNNYTCFPILGRAGIDALGYVFPERIPLWGADIWCRYLYGHVKRVAEVPITIAHICHHNGTRPQDHINKRIQANTPPVPMTPTAEEINKLLRILNPGPPGRK